MSKDIDLIKIDLTLNGLNCAHCAEQINEKVSEIEGIDSSNLNFVNKNLRININSAYSEDEILNKVINIINITEPDINITINKDKLNISKEINLILNGLNCAHCTEEINQKIKQLNDIDDCNLNFITKVLTININHNSNKYEVIDKVIELINSIEPGLDIQIEDIRMELNQKSNEELLKKEEKQRKIELLKLGFGSIVYILGIIESSFNIQSNTIYIAYILAYIIIGYSVLLKSFKNALNGRIFDENFLMSIATIGAIAIGEMPEAVGVMLFYKIGKFLQERAVNNSRKSIASLMEIRPEYANIELGSKIKKVSPYDIKIGDIIIVKPGEKVPLDGIVVEGTSMIDTSALTGESVLREITVNDEVLSGSINKNILLKIKVSKIFEDSTVSKILELVQNASSKKSKTENYISSFCKYYTPIVLLLAVIIAILPPLFMNGDFSQWFYRGLVFLVVSCPCALVLSIPLSFFSGIGVASKEGILIKGSNYLEALRNIDTIVFDKTGTLTKGVFTVSKIKSKNIEEDKLLEYAAIAEVNSNHPIAKSIVSYYKNNIDISKISEYEEIASHGIAVKYDTDFILAGNEKLMNKYCIFFEKCNEIGTVVYIAVNGNYKGYIVISDKIKKDTKTAIKDLKLSGIKQIVMLTGDNEVVAQKVANELGINKVYSNLLPIDKVNKLEEIFNSKDQKSKIAFVGDGINDAPVLSRADVGIAMGALGSDAAIEAADVVLMTDEISKISTALNIAKKTNKIVIQNIVFALGVKILVLMFSAGGVVNMWEAIFADVGVSLLAVINSMRIINKNKI